MNTKNIFLLSPGPKYDLIHEYRKRLTTLSAHYSGYLFTMSPDLISGHISNFTVITSIYNRNHNWVNKFRYAWTAFKTAIAIRRKNEVIDLVVAYDPLFTGIIGFILARLFFKCKIAIELNGDFNSMDNYYHISNKLLRYFKHELNTTIVKLLLVRADGIKLLYDKQIDWLVPLPEPRPVHTYFDFTDISQFTPGEEQNQILFVGFPMHTKGLDLLIEAFSRITSSYPEWTLKIIGFYPDDSQLFELIKRTQNIIYQKPVPYSEMPNHIRQCAFLVLPSRTEAMGRVLLEAMAANKPCIGSSAGGIPSVITNEINGLIFENGSVVDLEKKLITLMESEELRRQLGTAAGSIAHERYSADKYAEHTHKFYTEVLCTFRQF